MDFEKRTDSYTEDNHENFIQDTKDELTQNQYAQDNKGFGKRGCLAVFLAFTAAMISSVTLSPYLPKDDEGNADPLGYIFSLFVGLGIVILSLRALIIKLNSCTEKVEAYLLEATKQVSSAGKATFKPVYEYYFNGQLYRKETSISLGKAPETNRKVTLRINPNNPEEIFDLRNDLFSSLLFFMVGLIFLMPFVSVVINVIRTNK